VNVWTDALIAIGKKTVAAPSPLRALPPDEPSLKLEVIATIARLPADSPWPIDAGILELTPRESGC
jgi:hypothetical protein